MSVFQWWLKSLSDDEVDQRPLGDRYHRYIESACRGVDRRTLR